MSPPSELVLVWGALQRGWSEALSIWVPGGDTAPVADIAARVLRTLTLTELEAVIRHMSEKMENVIYRLVYGYVDFWEVWTIEAIREQGRKLT